MTELLKCPFCGWAPDSHYTESEASIYCPNELGCHGAHVRIERSPLDNLEPWPIAISTWNRRSTALSQGEAGEVTDAEFEAAWAAYIKDQRTPGIGLVPDPQDNIRAAINAVLGLRSMPLPASGGDGWRPIETAPKDGTRILCSGWAWGNPASNERVENLVHWDGEGWSTAFPGDAFDEQSHIYAPTHWMPLPAPPSTTDGKGK